MAATPAKPLSRAWRYVYGGLGFTCLGLGLIGVALPVMPTTIFLIIAAWAFARANPAWHRWLLAHKTFGPKLRAWEDYGAIPRPAKILAVVMMTASVWITWTVSRSDTGTLLLALVLVPVALYVVTRPLPGQPPPP